METPKGNKRSNSKVQDKLIDAMLDIKEKNPNMSHSEIIETLQYEFDRFIKFHKVDRVNLPKPLEPKETSTKQLNDRIPMRNIPYGIDNKKKGV